MKVMQRLLRKSLIPAIVLGVTFLIGMASPVKASAASSYPDKQINLVVAFGAGGTNDLGSRLIADYLAKKWKRQVVVVNKPGGNGVPAVLDVLNAKPDGYTLLVDVNASSAIQTAAMISLPYKLTDRTLLCRVLTASDIVCSSLSRPWKNLKDVADFVKSNPRDFKWGALGDASMSTLNIGMFIDGIGVDVKTTKKVDFNAAAEQLSALAGGHIDLMMFSVPGLMPLIEAKKVQPIVALGGKIGKLPGVQTTEEAGFGWWNTSYWLGISGPSNLPEDIIEKWESALKEAANDPEFKSKAESIGFRMAFVDYKGHKKAVLEEEQRWKAVAQKLGIVPR